MSEEDLSVADRLLGYHPEEGVHLERAGEHSELGRTPFERDVDRIKYTAQFRRLKDVTQVARAGETYLYHDRLSHSLKVAQVGRRLAEYILRVEARDTSDDPDSYLRESRALAEGQGADNVDEDLRHQLNPDLVEAACLAHDLGHPPFGHLAEDELDTLLQEKTNEDFRAKTKELRHENSASEKPFSPDDFDEVSEIEGTEPAGIRFEGNAQSFRILTRLASYRDAETGLGLTVGSLNGILKYPYGRGEWLYRDDHDNWERDLDTEGDRSRGKFGYYKTEAKAFEMIRENLNGGTRTIAAEVMDYADDLTYAIHDLTDFYMDGRLPLDRLLREASEDEFPHVSKRELDRVESDIGYDSSDLKPHEVVSFLAGNAYGVAPALFKPYEGTDEQNDDIEEFTSYLVERYLNRVYYPNKAKEELEDDDETDLFLVLTQDDREQYHLKISETLNRHIDILQDLTRHYVIRNSALMGQQRGQRQVIRELFEALYEEACAKDLGKSAIPKPHSDKLRMDPEHEGFETKTEQRAQIIADMISEMTEIQAVELHKRLTGDSPGSLQNQILR